jgi:hypothetical protein
MHPADLPIPESWAADGDPISFSEGDGECLGRPELGPGADAREDAPAGFHSQGNLRGGWDSSGEVSHTLESRRLRFGLLFRF